MALSLTFGGFLILLMLILWQQYLKQMRNLSAFCRVNPTKLNEIQAEFTKFKQNVEDEEHIEYHSQSEIMNQKSHHKVKTPTNQAEHDYKKSPNTWDLQKIIIFSLQDSLY
mgnify:CR=1 FL=1